MIRPADLTKLFRRNYSDITGIDLGASGTKVVKLSLAKGTVRLVHADLLPPLDLSGTVAPLILPKAGKSRYVALATTPATSTLKILTMPAHSDRPLDVQVGELIGIGRDDVNVRIGYELIQESRTEMRVLVVTFPNVVARAMCGLFPEGAPAPCSLEMSGLASLTAFSRGPGGRHAEDCVAVVDFGATSSLIAFYCKGSLVMIRKFEFGTVNILKKLQDSLGVDGEVAAGILNDESFDVSKIVHQSMESFLQQMTISFDFVERRESVRVKKLYACGGGVSVRTWAQVLESAMGHAPEVWNPFEGLDVAEAAFPERFKGQESRFTAAVGAALSMLRAG